MKISRETIKDKHGHIIAYYEHRINGDIYVYDNHGHLLGKANKYGTFDRYGHKILNKKEPGFLIKKY